MQFFTAMGCHELGHNDQPEVLSSNYEQKILKNYFCTVGLKIPLRKSTDQVVANPEERHIFRLP